ncbi:hypothetical protein HDU79_010222 [Rhizoclosmatium sp. JEL0117]|nr:hypothetical protein HDU79_010222 [Rhizoclosmatium sp. JEL0117]
MIRIWHCCRLNSRYSKNTKPAALFSQHRPVSISQRRRAGETETWTTSSAGSSDAAWRLSTRAHSIGAPSSPLNLNPANSEVDAAEKTGFARKTLDALMVTFLPKNYPRSVSTDYLPYSLWQFAHSVSGTVTGTLSTQALLHALGLGAAASAGLAATTNWIIKDGFGLLGGVLYAGSVATKFDDQPKRFRFLSAALIQFSSLLELLTPLMPHLFVPIASISNIGKNIGWLASSASRAAIHKGFTLQDNLGDVTAKSGAQSTMAGLLGTLVGIGLSFFIGASSSPLTLLQVFLPLSVFNMYCCYQSNHVVVTRTLNVERGELAIQGLVRDLAKKVSESHSDPVRKPLNASKLWNEQVDSLILPLQQVSDRETFVFGYKSVLGLDVLLEPSLARHVSKVVPKDLKKLFDGQTDDYRILLSYQQGSESIETLKSLVQSNAGPPSLVPIKPITPKDWKVCLWFLESSKPMDHFKAFYHSCLARQVFQNRVQNLSSTADFATLQLEFSQAVLDTREVVDETFMLLMTAMVRKGWHVEFNHFGDRDERIRFGN